MVKFRSSAEKRWLLAACLLQEMVLEGDLEDKANASLPRSSTELYGFLPSEYYRPVLAKPI